MEGDVDLFYDPPWMNIHALEIKDRCAWAKCSARSASHANHEGVDALGQDSLGSPHPLETGGGSGDRLMRREEKKAGSRNRASLSCLPWCCGPWFVVV